MAAPSITLLALLTTAATGCNNPNGPPSLAYNPQLPTVWSPAVTNPFFPLVPGTTWQYRAQTSAGLETIVFEVLPGTRLVNGVAATVVRDRVTRNGSLIEDTIDWFAQDGAGNVWYLGEQVKNISNGQVVDTEGSWEWGVDGALPGIYMWATPGSHVGEAYRQEFYKGKAEDWGKVITLQQSVTVAFGTFSGCIITEDWVGLVRSDPHANKTYCPQIGLVREVKVTGGEPPVELISKTP